MYKIFLSIFFTVFMFLPPFSQAHDFWLDVSTITPPLDSVLEVYVHGGHSFPESSIAVSERLLGDINIKYSDSKVIKKRAIKDKKLLKVSFDVEKVEPSLLYFTLKKPPKNKIVYVSKTILSSKEMSLASKPLGKIFELVPDFSSNEKLKKGNTLKVKALFNGKPIKITLAISANGKKNFYSRIDSKGSAKIKLPYPGSYLITASYKGVGTSMVFFVEDEK
jgi:uncharacterized GH25 family protein